MRALGCMHEPDHVKFRNATGKFFAVVQNILVDIYETSELLLPSKTPVFHCQFLAKLNIFDHLKPTYFLLNFLYYNLTPLMLLAPFVLACFQL